jgi:hypothetical protein
VTGRTSRAARSQFLCLDRGNLEQARGNYTKLLLRALFFGKRLVEQSDHFGSFHRVFIIPSQHDLHVFNGEFRLKPISKPRGWPDVITVFLRSLTENWDGKLIAVIVSGYDGDGAEALCGIKEVGGGTIAQKLDTAVRPDMPQSAIESGCIDFILSPEEIAGQIVRSAYAAPEAIQKGIDVS